MRFLILTSLCALAACGQSELERAKSELLFLQKSGAADRDDVCKAKRAVEQAALREQNDQYALLKVEANLACYDPMPQ